MVALGMDPHPGSPTVAALDWNGSLLGSIKVPSTSAGLAQLHQFASQFASRRWAIEGAGNRFVAQFVKELLVKGESIYPIAPSRTTQYRCRRGRKKNDQVDAANVARILLANPQLPPLQYLDRQRELQELSRTQRPLSEQLRSNRSALSELTQQSPVRAAFEEVIRTLTLQLSALDKQLQSIVRMVMPCLLELPGVGAIVAGTLLGQVGDPQRFPTADHFTSYRGVAPVERRSGQTPGSSESRWKSSSQLGAIYHGNGPTTCG